MSTSPVLELHINPTYSVCIPQRDNSERFRTETQRKNEQNLKDNSNKGVMSAKATKRLTNAVNWLVASAKNKWVYDKNSNKRFNFRVNFVTLTLPTTDHDITDNQFKADLLHNFINTCRYRYDMKNFVWKVEAQENGNIHAHFTTDTFIHWKDLRNVWNRILQKRGLIDKYRDKHSKMTFDEYNNLYNPTGEKTIEQIRRSFEIGKNSNWSDPNTTDVHSVFRVKDLAAYLAKYMSKKEEDRRKIKGRLWGCSYNLSENNKLVVEIQGQSDYDLLHELFKPEIHYKRIEAQSKLSRLPFTIGEIFFYKLSDWGKVLKGRLLEKFNEHRFNIRYNIDVLRPKKYFVDEVEQPLEYVFFSPATNSLTGNQLNLSI